MEKAEVPGASSGIPGPSTVTKTKAREVPARYLQARPTPAAARQHPAVREGGGGGRWVSASELDLPTCGSTPLYVHAPSGGGGGAAKARAQWVSVGNPTGVEASAPRTAVRGAPATAKRMPQEDAARAAKPRAKEAAGATRAGDIAPLSDAGPTLQQHHRDQQQQDREHMPYANGGFNGTSAVIAGGPRLEAGFISPGSDRSASGSEDESTGAACSSSGGGNSQVAGQGQQRQQQQQRQQTQAPSGVQSQQQRKERVSHGASREQPAVASMPRQMQQLGLSVDMAMTMISGTGNVPASAAVAERRRLLEEYRQQRAAAAAAAAAVAAPAPKAESASVFKQPAPRPPGSVFRATAAMLEPPTSTRRGGTWHGGSCADGSMSARAPRTQARSTLKTPRGSGVGAGYSAGTSNLSTEVSYASSTGSSGVARRASQAASVADPAAAAVGGTSGGASAFRATMATLQQGKAASPAAGPSSSGALNKALPVPKLSLHLLGRTPRVGGSDAAPSSRIAAPPSRVAPAPPVASAGTASAAQTTPQSASRIPRIAIEQLQPPLTARAVGRAAALPLPDEGDKTWDAAQVALPDATPRGMSAARDAVGAAAARRPSQLPRTPTASPKGLPSRESSWQAHGTAAADRLSPPPIRRGSGIGASLTPQDRAGSTNAAAPPAAAAAAALRQGATTPLASRPSAALTPRGASGARVSVTPRGGAAAQQPAASTPPQSSRSVSWAGGRQTPQAGAQHAQASARTPRGAQPQPSLTPHGQPTLTPRGKAALTPRGSQHGSASHQRAASHQPQLNREGSEQPHVPAGEARQKLEEQVQGFKEQLRILRMQELQWRHMRAKAAVAHSARKAKGERALACVAAAVIDLQGQVVALQAAHDQAQWQEVLGAALGEQLPLLRAWREQQDAQTQALSSVKASLRAALSRLPLINGATAGPKASAPDVAALQAVLQRGVDAMQRMQPALKRLLGAQDGQQAQVPDHPQQQEKLAAAGISGSAAPSVVTTASYARELIDLACEEVRRLGIIKARLEQLSDAALYANSMEVQLLQMGTAAGPV